MEVRHYLFVSKLMKVIFESIFDIAYLTTVITLGFKLFKNASSKDGRIFGFMAIILGCGDAFHLVPRVIGLLSGKGLEHFAFSLGIGKFVTSITMTVFYLLLFEVYKIRYKVENIKKVTIVIYFLAILRILLCLMPQNEWTVYEQPYVWGIYRNLPFAVLGFWIAFMFYKAQRENRDIAFKNMWLTIILSFGFYIPVVLFATFNPTVAMLMIPKTLAYVWSVLIGYKEYNVLRNKKRYLR